jgi:hypothetical protein
MRFPAFFFAILFTYDAFCIYLPTSRHHACEPIRSVGVDVPFGAGRFLDDTAGVSDASLTSTASLKENVVNYQDNQDSVFFFPALQRNPAFAEHENAGEYGEFVPTPRWHDHPTPGLSFLSSEDVVRLDSNGELFDSANLRGE